MSLQVSFGPRRFKIPVAAGTLLAQVRQQVCAQLGLSAQEDEYGLTSHGKALDLSLPFRLTNLVNNAPLELVRRPKGSSGASADAPLRIKVRIPASADHVGTYPGTTTIQSILDKLGLHGDLLLNGTPVPPEKELRNVGSSGTMFTFAPAKGKTVSGPPQPSAKTAPPSVPPSAAPSTKSPQPSATNQQTTQKSAQPAQPPQPREARVVPATSPQIEETPSEPTQQQFLAYYHQLKSQAEPPMLSKQTREALQAQRAPVDATVCRIRFPDSSVLEGKFVAGECGADVFRFVNLYLEHPEKPYDLVSMKPAFTLGGEMLLSEQLGQRALLVFRPHDGRKTGFLNEKARRLMPQKDDAAEKAAPAEKSRPVEKEAPSAGPKKKGVPKWLKLHKK